MDKPLSLHSHPNRILIISMRHLGDVLLTTPLLHSLRKGFPNSQIDILVYRNTAAILEGNPDIDQIITTPQRATWSDIKELFKQLVRHYDLAIVTQTGDRRFIYALFAAPLRIAFVPARHEKGWWKRYLVQSWSEFDNVHSHAVLQLLKFADLIGIPSSFSLVPPQLRNGQQLPSHELLADKSEFAVLHVYPLRRYKHWTVSGWIEVGNYLRKRGLKLVLSGGPAKEELDYVSLIHQQLPADTINLAGRTSLAQLTDIIKQAQLYIGPDTGTTHLAAATGTPVIALYGPTNPVQWAPWPINYRKKTNPFQAIGSQHVNNVYLIQGEADCVPCDQEGCDRHRQSHSWCLDTLATSRVKKAIQDILRQNTSYSVVNTGEQRK